MGKGKTSRCKLRAETVFSDLASPVLDSAIAQAREIEREASVEALHQLRIALRTLQTLWWLYRPLISSKDYTQQRSIVKSIAKAAGKARDCDVLLVLLNLQGTSTSGLIPAISAARQIAVDEGKAILSPLTTQTSLWKISFQSRASVVKRQERHPLRAFAKKRVAKSKRQLRKRIKQAVQAKKPDLEAFHDVRKAGKKTRYLLELLEPFLSADHHNTLKGIKKILKPLGDLNDVVVSERLLLENPSLLASTDQPTAICHWFQKERKYRLNVAAYLLRKDWK